MHIVGAAAAATPLVHQQHEQHLHQQQQHHRQLQYQEHQQQQHHHQNQQQQNQNYQQQQPEHHQQQRQQHHDTEYTARSRNENLMAMRKHRSLDSGQFLAQFQNQSSSIEYEPSTKIAYSHYTPSAHVSGTNPPQQSMLIENGFIHLYDYYNPTFNDSNNINSYYSDGIYDRSTAYNTVHNAPYDNEYVHYVEDIPYDRATNRQIGSIPHNTDDYEMLKRECATMNQKLNYVMNSIRTFWSPELKKERQLRKEEALRISTLQYKLSQQAAEIQRVRNELEKREKDISQLFSENDLGEMEAELRRLRAQLHMGTPCAGEMPRDFTDKAPTFHELQTARTKMERSELALAGKTRDLSECEVRLKCSQEQNAELEKRIDVLSKSVAANEAQLKLLHDDLDVLRSKLETKNQQIESRDKCIKSLEKELETAKSQIQQHLHTIQENERQISQLSHRIDQMEIVLRERNLLVDRLKQRLAQSPDGRYETELQQRLENSERDKAALQKAIDELRRTSDIEKQNQLQIFQEENRQLCINVENLQKELSDRHVLIVSQNDKISQLDAELRNNSDTTRSNHLLHSNSANNPSVSGTTTENTFNTTMGPNSNTSDRDVQIEEAHNEIGRLLSIIRQLEKEKNTLTTRLNNIKAGVTSDSNLAEGADIPITTDSSFTNIDAILAKRSGNEPNVSASTILSPTTAAKSENNALRSRIDALEEALRESVGITSERDHLVAEQKEIIQQLSNQVTELFKNCGGKDLQRLLQDALKRVESSEKALNDERLQSQHQITSLRREVTMVAIREKDTCIQLLRGPPDSIRDKIDLLIKQKEQLKHKLLAINDLQQPMITGGLPVTTSVQANNNDVTTGEYGDANAYRELLFPRQVPAYSMHCPSTTFSTFQRTNDLLARKMTPINITVPAYNIAGISAPASLNYGKDDVDNDGIWA